MNNESIMGDSCVMYDEPNQYKELDQETQHQKSSQQGVRPLDYHASNERSQLSDENEEDDGVFDEVAMQHQKSNNH